MVNNTVSDSIRKRYFYKLLASPFSLGLAILISSIVPRALGPEKYGDFGFLQNSFYNLIGIITAGSSHAFFIYNSKNKNSFPAIIIYFTFIIIISCVVFLLIITADKFQFSEIFWPNQNVKYIFMAAIFSLLFWLADIIQGYMDSKGFTVQNEIIKSLNKIWGTLLILSLFFTGYLSLKTFFLYHYVTLSTFIITISIVIRKKNAIGKISKLSFNTIKKVFAYFVDYCKPLFFYGMFGSLVAFSYRWLLQFSSGSTEQGYFTLAYQLSSIVIIFTAYFIPIFMREISILFSKNEHKKIRNLVVKSGKIFLSISVFLSVFLTTHSANIIQILAGTQFSKAYLPVTIMLLYPIFQTIGQLNGTILYSLNKTKLYSKIGYFNNTIGFLCTYLLIAPKDFIIPGLSLGAGGLAIATLLITVMSTNILTYYSYKIIGLNFSHFLIHEIVVISLYIIIAFLSKISLHHLFNFIGISNQIFLIIATFFVYFIILLILNYKISWLTDITKSEIRENIISLKRLI